MNENPLKLYTLEEAAKYCKRSYKLLRTYYSQGILPEPRISLRRSPNHTRRLFTLIEVKALRHIFDSAPYGEMARRRRKRNAKINRR